METQEQVKTTQDRFNNAMQEIRKNKITARRNVSGCCRSCAGVKMEEHKTPIIWHYGGQGARFTWESGEPIYASTNDYKKDEPVNIIYFNHDGLNDENGTMNDAGRLVLDIFTKHGLTVDWNGDNWSCIKIIFTSNEETKS